MGVVAANTVTFSAGATVRAFIYGNNVPAALSTLVNLGSIKHEVTFNVEQTFRQKKDGFPQVVIAEAIDQQTARLELVLQEWKQYNIQVAFGLRNTDVTAAVSGGRTYRTYPIGRVGRTRYNTVAFTEELANGGRTELIMWRARIGLRGNLSFHSVNEGADLPIVIEANYDPTRRELMTMREWTPTV